MRGSSCWECDDPRVVLAMVLECERARRTGSAPPPRLTVECRGTVDPLLLDAIRRHAAWVEVSTGAPATTPSDARREPPASFNLTQAELSMLFGAAPGATEPA